MGKDEQYQEGNPQQGEINFLSDTNQSICDRLAVEIRLEQMIIVSFADPCQRRAILTGGTAKIGNSLI
ncbi:MAG TPA: hypothetical protein V6D12_17000 [Candidatus Obscuribacterales bacterium]